MKVLVVCAYRSYAKHTDYVAPFIYEQVNSLREKGIEIEYCRIKGGIKGYLKTVRSLKQIISTYHSNIVHAHGGLCGFVATLQSLCPVVTTYHGSDINNLWTRYISYMAILRSKCNIFVSQRLKRRVGWLRKKYAIVPCGVDTSIFYPMDKNEAREKLGWNADKVYILFSKQFNVKVKNYPLAKAAVELLPNVELVELKGYTREQVACLMNASDVALMTSFTEGSPQFVKEAMACACPVVSTDVGDVRELLQGIDNSYITTYEPQDVANALFKVLSNGNRNEQAYARIRDNYELSVVAEKLICIYKKVTGK